MKQNNYLIKVKMLFLFPLKLMVIFIVFIICPFTLKRSDQKDVYNFDGIKGYLKTQENLNLLHIINNLFDKDYKKRNNN